MSPKEAVQPNITEMLHEWSSGKAEVMNELLPLIYDELRKRAAAYLRRERPNHTLQATALVHEAYLKLIDQREDGWKNGSISLRSPLRLCGAYWSIMRENVSGKNAADRTRTFRWKKPAGSGG
jgi:hypothetical protein